MLVKNLTRQLDLIPVDRLTQARVTIIGAGAVGSFTALSLAKMGVSDITVFDGDTISDENMNCQFYPFAAIGEKKVTALQKLIQAFSGTQIKGIDAHYAGPQKDTTDRGPFPGIVIAAVDNMATRKLLWDTHKGHMHTSYFIDPRMGGEYALVYTMNPNDERDQESYEKTLYTDAEATPERCTARATIYTALLLSGMVCKTVKDCLTGSNYARIVDWNIGQNAQTVWKKKKEKPQ